MDARGIDLSDKPTWWTCATRMSRTLQELRAEDLRDLVLAVDPRQRVSSWTKAELAWFVARTTVSRFYGPQTMLGVLTMAGLDPNPVDRLAHQPRLGNAA